MIPPNAASAPNADLKIIEISAGTSLMFKQIITTARPMYIMAMNGTTAVATFAIDLIPPNIIRISNNANTIAMTH
ncbi:Uncharacterised protein [Staphylococcus aureus]|nr:Uncharacterised protein [Staphylococcus aureus]